MPEARIGRQFLPWAVVAIVVVLAGAAYLSLDRKISALSATSVAQITPQTTSDLGQAPGALDHLEQIARDNQASEQKLADQIVELQRRVAVQDGERKLLSDQLGSLSSRVDALASAHATINNPAPIQKGRRARQ